ncbi:MAG: hypothetical protein A2900_04920 [Candidatus Chisholmbacteria bacterium RIFCSPLOWO2_01_FULL_50_28]|nr:MAG: hypothetical protein A2900_04920 [Candidatus Chisholmbacteria bacterium RIFCSPLOWO2_01_FULL_50_28]
MEKIMTEKGGFKPQFDQPDEHRLSNAGMVDLSFLESRDGAIMAWRTLKYEEDRFAPDWRGGVHGSYSLEDIRAVIQRFFAKEPSSLRRVSLDSQYAIAQAFRVLGAPYTDESLSAMRDRVLSEIEHKTTHGRTDTEELEPSVAQNSVLVPAIHGLAHKRLNRKRGLLLAAAFATVAGTWAVVNQTDWLNPSQEGGSLASTTGDGQVSDPGEAVASESDLSGSALLEGLAPLFDAIQPEPTPVPLVESLPSAENNPCVLWGGIDFCDPSQAITVEWDSPEIREVRNGEPLRINFFPEPKANGSQFASQCLTSLGIDCSMALEGKVIVGVHSSWNGEEMLAMEAFRTFLEGGTKQNPDIMLPAEERERREYLLESVRPTITQGTLRVSAKASILRIEEAHRDGVYEDWNTAQDTALLYEPDLRASINLDRRYVDVVTCGWRLPGDRLSPKNHNAASSSIYNLFLGEAPTSS